MNNEYNSLDQLSHIYIAHLISYYLMNLTIRVLLNILNNVIISLNYNISLTTYKLNFYSILLRGLINSFLGQETKQFIFFG